MSDLTIHDESVVVWLRSPKVLLDPAGSIVEVWKVEMRKDLDPITALLTFLDLRKKVFGTAEALPVFLHENGAIFSKQELNNDLKNLLSIYPELSTERDKWTGHSFRSGLSTILSVLGRPH